MDIVFLGTGTSTGIPQIGCNCKVCKSPNIKDKRLRASVVVTTGKKKILIDCGPDFRQQLLSNNINDLSAILLTHEHYDHIGGLDDLRPLGRTKLYAEKNVLAIIHRNMPYCFVEKKYPGVPTFELNEISENPFLINDVTVQPIRIMHAKLAILGFRIGNFAYLTDVKTLDIKSIEQLNNLDVLVINALRIDEHISHISIAEALDLAKKINARQTYFTHMSHDMGLHDEVNMKLPRNIQLAYDGQTFTI